MTPTPVIASAWRRKSAFQKLTAESQWSGRLDEGAIPREAAVLGISEATSSEAGTKEVGVAMKHYECRRPPNQSTTYAVFTKRIAAEFMQ